MLSEAFELEEILGDFVSTWTSHGDKVKGYANLFFGTFIVIMADETGTGVSGCSTDSSVRLIKDIEKRFQVQLFDRENLTFYINNKIQHLPLNQLAYAIENSFIKSDTIYFNNLVLTKKELEQNWLIPVRQSWLAKRYDLKEKEVD